MTLSVLLINNRINIPIIYVEIMIIPWRNQNVHIVAKLPIIDVWKSKGHEMKKCCLQEMVLRMVWIIVIIQ